MPEVGMTALIGKTFSVYVTGILQTNFDVQDKLYETTEPFVISINDENDPVVKNNLPTIEGFA